MTTKLTWGGVLTNELVGGILCLASELGEPYYSRAIEFIKYCPTYEETIIFITEMENKLVEKN